MTEFCDFVPDDPSCQPVVVEPEPVPEPVVPVEPVPEPDNGGGVDDGGPDEGGIGGGEGGAVPLSRPPPERGNQGRSNDYHEDNIMMYGMSSEERMMQAQLAFLGIAVGNAVEIAYNLFKIKARTEYYYYGDVLMPKNNFWKYGGYNLN